MFLGDVFPSFFFQSIRVFGAEDLPIFRPFNRPRRLVDPVEEAAVDAVGTVIFRDGLILMVNGGKKPSKIGKNYGNIRGIYIYIC